jgi:para-nitrobenzyl esterase
LIYGANCPQRLHDWVSEQSFLFQWTDGWQSEDMLKVNIWTSSLTGRRPVMFYIHGGGYTFGSAYELASQDGAQMARHHDVVSVTVNHRLNALGFLDVSELGGPAYADSANVGMTDLVAALRWVRDNIANFGGDPDRVMIYGQSGGGSKVTTLLGMPSAKGLIHTASAQSGGGGNPPSLEQSRELSRQIFAALGVKDIAALQKMEWARLNEVGNAVVAKMNPPLPAGAGPTPDGGAPPRVGFGPTVDGTAVTMRAFFEGAPEISKQVPMLIGSVSEEGNRMSSRPTESQWLATLTRSYGEAKAAALVAALKKAYPHKSIRTLSYMCSGAGLNGLGMRNNVTRMATMKHAQQGAPVFTWYFTWQSPMLEDAGAWHTAELAFCFDNTARCAQGTGNGPEAQALAKRMATAWANFARTGNPSQPGLPWTPFTPEGCPTMVFDAAPRIVNDPEAEARKILLS